MDTYPATGIALSVRLARTIALVQSGVALGAAGLGGLYAITSKISDDRAARAGGPDDFSGLGTALGLWFAGIMLLVALGVGLPALLLRHTRTASAGWPLLFAAEAVLLVIGVQAAGITDSGLGVAVWTFSVGTAAAVVAALLHPSAGRWALHIDDAGSRNPRVDVVRRR